MLETVALTRYAYIDRDGARAVSNRIARATVKTKWEALKGGHKFIGIPADAKTARMMKRRGHPKNQEIYFESRDIL